MKNNFYSSLRVVNNQNIPPLLMRGDLSSNLSLLLVHPREFTKIFLKKILYFAIFVNKNFLQT